MRRAAALLAAACVALAGCGGGEEPAAEGDRPPEKPALKPGELPEGNVARVTDTLISEERYEHWLNASRKQENPCRGKACLEQTMEFLLSGEWLAQEAAAQGIGVTEQEIDEEFERQRKEAFPSAKDYEEFLRQSGQTEEDVRYRIELSLLSDKLQKRASQGVAAKDRQRALDRFVEGYERRYRAKTICAPAYKVEQCGSVAPG